MKSGVTMHQAVLDYVGSRYVTWRTSYTEGSLKVLEFGSLDINGSVRSILQRNADLYIGVDVQNGPGVDVVADAETYDSDIRFDVIACCEVFEHTPRWREIITNSHRLLKDGGLFIATMAGEGRSPHSAIDENPIRDWEYYDNVGGWELNRAMSIFRQKEINTQGTDIRTFGIK